MQAPRRTGFPGMMIMMLLPVIVGSLAALVGSWTGFIEAAFMDMTLTLEGFDYRFGPSECNGEWTECGNATFESYQRSRDLAIVLFILALVVVAARDMLKGGIDVDVGAADTKTLPEMLKYSVLVFAFLFMFPPIWDVASDTMNNVGIWILNPEYNLAGRSGYEHGAAGLTNPENMCTAPISYEDMVDMAPYVRDYDAWAIYTHGDRPLAGTTPSTYHTADNYIIQRGESLSLACLEEIESPACTISTKQTIIQNRNAGTAGLAGAVIPGDYQIGDILCNPDFRVKYVFRQALGIVEMEAVSPEQLLGSVSGVGGDDILVGILTQFLKSSVTLQVIMVTFMTGVMVDVVTSFALAILPIVFFYRFLPMSNKVRLSDYSSAAFALLAMPLVASLVLVAGSGAVANMAADDQEFGSFFTWLAALSVVLLVIGVPATMVPLIGSAQAQATAAIQTGVQTATFAVSTMGAAAGGAIRSGTESAQFNRLSALNNAGQLKAGQQATLNALKSKGYGEMSTARAALQGGMSGMRRELYDDAGKPTQGLRNTLMPGTDGLSAASVKGLGGFEGGDATRGMPDASRLLDTAGGVAGGVAMTASDAKKPPTPEQMLASARAEEAAAKADLNRATKDLKKADAVANKTKGYTEEAAAVLSAQRLAQGEMSNIDNATKAKNKAEAGLRNITAKNIDLQRSMAERTEQLNKAGVSAEEQAEQLTDITAQLEKSGEMMAKINHDIATSTAELNRAKNALATNQAIAAHEMASMVARAQSTDVMDENVRSAILAQHEANTIYDAADARYADAQDVVSGVQEDIENAERAGHDTLIPNEKMTKH